MPSRPIVIKHISEEELREIYRHEKSSYMKTRILAIIHIFQGKSTTEVGHIINISSRSVRRWLVNWNKEGYENLKPNFSGGPNPKLKPKQWKEIISYIENRGMDISDLVK